jgi:hypothetical protein
VHERRFQILAFKQLVDYNEVKFLSLCHFNGGILQSQLDDVVNRRA